jgi:hypothetical protein
MRYSDLRIKTLDQNFIDDLLDEYNLEPSDIEIDVWYIEHWFTNVIISSIYREAISRLEVSDEAQDLLYANIYTNYLDSGIDVTEQMLDDLSEEDKKICMEFLDL